MQNNFRFLKMKIKLLIKWDEVPHKKTINPGLLTWNKVQFKTIMRETKKLASFSIQTLLVYNKTLFMIKIESQYASRHLWPKNSSNGRLLTLTSTFKPCFNQISTYLWSRLKRPLKQPTSPLISRNPYSSKQILTNQLPTRTNKWSNSST